MSSEGLLGLLRGPLQTLRGSPYELRGSLRRSVKFSEGTKILVEAYRSLLVDKGPR